MVISLGLLSHSFAQDSAMVKQGESRAQKKARMKREDHPNALTDEQRKQIKFVEEDAVYKRKVISFDPNLTPPQRRAKILETKKEMMLKVKSILTPQQYVNIMKKKSKGVETVAMSGPSGPIKYENRGKTIIKTLEVMGDSVKLEFYDNGAVDGDSISVFYNNNLIVQHLMLTEKPAPFMIKIDKSIANNEIVMYAENLGTEPPNTALLVVTDGPRHYEVDVSSDLKKSGTIYLRPVTALKKVN